MKPKEEKGKYMHVLKIFNDLVVTFLKPAEHCQQYSFASVPRSVIPILVGGSL
jgi:hypothetical protein